MSNNLVNQEWVAQESLRQLYVNCVMAGLVHRGFDGEFKGKKGDTARILKPVAFTAQDFSGEIIVQDISESYIPLVMDIHKDVSFEYGSAEKALLMPDFRSRYIEPALKAIAEAIDEKVINKGYRGFFTYHGTAGTTPTTKESILQARKNLQTQLVELGGRRFVMDPAAEAEYLELFSDADKDGSTAALREASLGRRFGLDTYMDQHISTTNGGLHTPSNVDPGILQVNAAHAAGSTSVALEANDGTMTAGKKVYEGDIISFTGYAGTYVVTAEATVASNAVTVSIDPVLPAVLADHTVATILGNTAASGAQQTYTNNLIFQKGAIALAFAALEKPDGAAWSQVVNYKGFALRLVKSYNATTKQEVLSVDVLCGTRNIDGRLGTRLVG